MNQQSWVDQVFRFFVTKREQTIAAFKVLYIGLLILLAIGGWSIYRQDSNFLFFYTLGVNLGRAALVVYILTTIPGITRRFGIKHKLISILMIFRRYIGITMYLLVFTHYWWVKGIEVWFHKIFTIPPPLFQTVGLTALFLLTPMVLTSSDWAVKKLGIWWYRIHKVTYVVVGLIFLHTAFQRISIWSVLIGITFIAQVASHIYGRIRSPRV